MGSGPSSYPIREIPFGSMGGLYDQDDVQAALEVLQAAADAGGSFFPLPEEADFQNAFARHEGADHAVAVNSCGTALDLCMMALGVGPGDEVITTPLTFVCTATCALARGAEVVLADVDPETLCLDPDQVRRRMTDRTRAVIPVHFAGLAADCGAFGRLARDTGVAVVYDAAHAVSTKWQGRPIGGFGQASCYSFQSNKNMTTLGEGGAVTTDDGEFAESVRRMKTFGYVYGKETRVVTVGFNYRMTKVQAAVGISQLRKIDRVVARRLEAFREMHRQLEGVEEIIRPAGIEPGHGCHLYVCRLDTERVPFGRDAFLKTLKQRYRVSCGIHYPPVWNWDVLARRGYGEAAAGCPVAALAGNQVFSLPLFPRTTNEDCAYLAWALKQSLLETA